MTELSESSVSPGTPRDGNRPSPERGREPLIQECSISSCAVGLLLGSTCSMLRRNARASSVSHMGIVYSPADTFSNSATMLSSVVGRRRREEGV